MASNRPPKKKGYKEMKRQDKYQDTSTFHFHNANPKNKITGDCVIRAISTAMERPYNEVYKELFEFSVKYGYMLNDKKCYEKYLEAQGWTKHAQPRKDDNTKYTGWEFCERLSTDITAVGKTIIAHIGGHHLVCIKETGRCGYHKVHDHWNSTDGCIGNYWTKR